MNNEPKAGKGIDPELLAAYVDNRLSPEQRAVVETQLATDPDSYAVLADTLKALDDEAIGVLAVTTPSRPAENPKAPVRLDDYKAKRAPVRWLVAAGVLTAAASLLLVLRGPGFTTRGSDDANVDALRLALIDAVADQRMVEVRLTGGFPHVPQRSLRSPSAISPGAELSIAAADIESKLEGSNSAEARHLIALAQLQTARYLPASRALQALCAESQSPQYCSDYAASLVVRAHHEGDDSLLGEAEDVLERVIAANPRLLEAWFNRALIQAAKNPINAGEAWQAYLRVDSDPASPWAAEARQRLESGSGPKVKP